MTYHIIRILKFILALILLQLSTLISTLILYRLESFLFEVMGYRWGGPYDLLFGILALLEVMFGFWVGLIFLPKRLKINIRNYLDVEIKQFFGYVILIGLILGVGFFGMLKVILIVGTLFLR